MNKKNSEQFNNGINNKEISSAKTLDNQNLSYDVRNIEDTILANHSEQWNNGIENEEISSAKTLDNQNLSKEIKMEDDLRNRDNTITSRAAAENCREFRLGKTQAANLIPSPTTTMR